MISWIQRYFQKHFRLVFAVILIAVALPMVVIYSSSGGGGRNGASKLLERPFFGRNLGNAEETRRIFNDATWSIRLKAGYDALQSGQLQQYALQRVAGLALADELHLPVPTADQVAKSVATLHAFQNEQGQFDPARYSQFADSLKTRTDLTGADVNRILRDDVRLEALSKLVGGPGYVLPRDIKEQLSLADSIWTVQVATLDYAAFNPGLNPTEETLKKFHVDNAFRYDVPARPRLSLVEFKGSDYLPSAAPTEAELRAAYNSNPARFPVPADADKKDDKPVAPGATVDNFPKVRAQVEAALKMAVGARGASKAANDFATALYDRKLAANSPELAAFLAEQHHPAKAVAPFAPDQPPADMPWLANYAEPISRLSQERHFSDPLPTTDSFVILLWNENLPGYKPLFAEVRERVLADYKDSEKRKLFIARGQALRTQLQAAAKIAPANFATAAAAEKLEVKSYAGFTLRAPPQDIPYLAFGALQQGLEAGQVSEMVADAEKGYLVFAQEKKLPDLTPANPRYAELQQQMMARTANSNSSVYLGGMVEAELKKSEPANAARP
jgi:peptidyl-prolyl cis-trans isomerase D